MRSARAPSRVQIEPESPYGVSLASRSASSSPSNGMTAATGPNTSSRATLVVVRRLDEGAREPEARAVGGLAAEGDLSLLHERRHRLAVLGRDQRAHLGLLARRVADLHAAGRVDEQLEEAVVDGPLDEDPRAGATVLACVVEDGVRGGGGRLLQVGVREDHVGGLAAELEGDALDRRGGALHDAATDLGRAREADLGDVRMLDHPLADDGALAGDDVDDALRGSRRRG